MYFDCFNDFAEHSLSDSEPSVSYSVIGMWSVKILRTSESVEPGLSDSRNCISWDSESLRRLPTRRTLLYSGSLLWKSFKIIEKNFEDELSRTYPVRIVFVLMIDKWATNWMIRSTVNISTVRAFAVSLLVKLKCRVWTQIFDVFLRRRKTLKSCTKN